MLATFWSNFHQSGTTSNAAALSVMIALEYRLRLLITHNQYERSGLETTFLDRQYVRNELLNSRDVGIDALSGFVRYNKADKDNILTFTTTLINKKLDMLPGTTITNKELYIRDMSDVIENLLAAVKESYDLVIIDASGENELKDMIIEQSDIIVVNLTQNYNALEHFFQQHGNLSEKCIFILSRYDKDSRLNRKNIMRRYGLKDKLAVIPYNIEYSDACMEGKLIDFLIRNLKADREDANFELMTSLRDAAEFLLKKLNINIELKKLGD